MTEVTKCCSLHQTVVPKGLSAPALGLYACIKSWKKCIKSDFKEIFLKLVVNDRSDKRFLLTSKFCPLGLSAPDLRPYTFEPSHEIIVGFVLHKLLLQTHMRSHPMGLDVWFLVGPFVYSHISCVRTARALVRLSGCAGSPEPSLVAYVISTITSWAGSFINSWKDVYKVRG